MKRQTRRSPSESSQCRHPQHLTIARRVAVHTTSWAHVYELAEGEILRDRGLIAPRSWRCQHDRELTEEECMQSYWFCITRGRQVARILRQWPPIVACVVTSTCDG